MLSAFLKLLTVAALALMPFGMSAASAGAAHHAPAAATDAAHCGEEPAAPGEEDSDPMAGCTAGCPMLAAASAADEVLAPAKPPLAAPPGARDWASLPPETATPPPKRA